MVSWPLSLSWSAQAFTTMSITISSPSSGSTVGTSFDASGDETVEGEGTYLPVSGSMTSTGLPIVGMTTQQPTVDNGGSWIIHFSSIPTGTGYTLEVMTTAESAQVGDLTVT